MGKKKFINKKTATKYHPTMEYTDPEETPEEKEERLKEQAKWNIDASDDDYNYLRHLRFSSKFTKQRIAPTLTTDDSTVHIIAEEESKEEPSNSLQTNPTDFYDEEFEQELEQGDFDEADETEICDLLKLDINKNSNQSDENGDDDEEDFDMESNCYEECDEEAFNGMFGQFDSVNINEDDVEADSRKLSYLLKKEDEHDMLVALVKTPLDKDFIEQTLNLTTLPPKTQIIEFYPDKLRPKGFPVYTNADEFVKFNPVFEEVLELDDRKPKYKPKDIEMEDEEIEPPVKKLTVEETTRSKTETKEEKKLRKLAVKQHNKERREQKKDLKLVYKEKAKQINKSQACFKGYVSINANS